MKKQTGRQTGSKEAGGTLLGLILGALLGLGAALAVAVYVTKVPIPFLNTRGPSQGAENDAAEARKNRDWDPNAALAGKNAIRPPVAAGNLGTVETPVLPPVPAAVPAVTATPASAPTVAAAPAPKAAASAAAKPAAVPAAKPPSADPLGDLAKERAAAKPDVKADTHTDTASAGSTGADPFSYFIQVGAFRTPEDAEQQRAKLTLLGFQAKVTEREQSGRTVYRVRLGPFDNKDDADKTKTRLDNNSIETALVRVQR
jgi:cell division protein FtsN